MSALGGPPLAPTLTQIVEACARVLDGRARTTSDPIRAAESLQGAQAIRSGAWRACLDGDPAPSPSSPVTPEP